MNTNEGKTATNATKTAATPATKAKTTNERKEGTKTMKKNATPATKTAAAVKIEDAPKNAPATMTAAEMIIEAAKATPAARKIAAKIEAAKTAAKKEDRAAFAEEAAAMIADFNRAAFENAAARASFIAAAEAERLPAPKKEESRKAGVDYARRAEPIDYPYIMEDGKITSRKLRLPAFAVYAFAGKTATKEQREAYENALAAVERFQKNNVEKEGAAAREGLKEAAAALTALSKACGLHELTTKTAENGTPAAFFIHKSFVHNAAARMKGKRGVYTTHAAARQEAAAAAVNASERMHAAAVERAERAEAAAVKMIFTIITEAAAAAVVGVWSARVLTAEEAAAARAAREAAEAKKAKERAEAKKREAAEKAKE